jgi:hypothetical protein
MGVVPTPTRWANITLKKCSVKMSSRITNFTRHLDEPELCSLLCEFVELKLQLKFLESRLRQSAREVDPTPAERVVRRAPRKPPSGSSRFCFRCMRELYAHTIPLAVDDSDWSVELYTPNSKLPHGYSTLQLRKAFYTRKAYAFIVSVDPHARFPETLAAVRTVMEQSGVSLHVRTQPLIFGSIDEVLRAPMLLLALYNDPHEVFVHGCRNDAAADDASYVEFERKDHRLRYRICAFQPDDQETSGALVLLVYETLTRNASCEGEEAVVMVHHVPPEGDRVLVQRDNDRTFIGDEQSTFVLACNMHFFDGALDDLAENQATCRLENCHLCQFDTLRKLVMTEHDERTIHVSRHKAGSRCAGSSCVDERCGDSKDGTHVYHTIRSAVIMGPPC